MRVFNEIQIPLTFQAMCENILHIERKNDLVHFLLPVSISMSKFVKMVCLVTISCFSPFALFHVCIHNSLF